MRNFPKPSFLGDESSAPTLAPSTSSIMLASEKDFDGPRSPITPMPPASPTHGTMSSDEKERERGGRASTGDSAGEVEDGQKPAPTQDLRKTATVTTQSGRPIEQVPTREDGTPYPKGIKLAVITIALCLAVFLMALDNAIITTAIPRITDQFHSLEDVGWYGSAYLLTTAALQLLFGKFYTFFSIKWIYLIAIGLFELGSLICGVANSSLTLILGRAIAGLGSAGLFSGSLIILAHSVPMATRPLYTGLIGSMYGIASVAGPLLGGVFTDRVTWRWCFYINLPIGAITIVVIALWFEDPKRQGPDASQSPQTWRQRLMHFDPIGTMLFMPAVISLLLALQWGGTEHAWGSGRIVALLVVFGVLIAAWLYVQYRQQDMATVPPRIIGKRTVWSGSLYSFCVGGAFLSAVYFIPIWFQSVKGATAVESGVMNLPMLLAVVIMSIVAGGAVTYWGYYAPFMLLGTLLTSVGFGLISTWTQHTDRPVWIGYQVLAGAGVGLGMQQPLMAVQTVLSIEDVPTGTSVVVFLQTLGGALFVSICHNVFTNRLVENLTIIFPNVDVASVLRSGATNLADALTPELVPVVLGAYSSALTRTFLVSAALSAISIIGSAFIEWESVKGKKVEMAMA
ncbi:major facilitator superfamily transporter [Magnaporthiopsis poae ATCC 64411]|uniref:Major facilitator superfamily transporter n=1 Tax=Magnaporthiopsis poae (strain ATCC 64411 / 73-15) TaxID=644358 RepID=A0A0C4EBX1_MAGP6|nr:major facilitator superfamily transporter [Magnaporthiopsis poae ATCC 64411]